MRQTRLGANFTIFLLLLLNDSQVQADWQAIETTKFEWGKTNGPYTMILEKRHDEYRLRIETPGHADFVLPIAIGVLPLNDEIVDQTLTADNLVKSSYFYLSPKLKDQSGRPMLLVFGEAFGSDPGGLHIVALNQKGVPLVVFSSKAFELRAITDDDWQ